MPRDEPHADEEAARPPLCFGLGDEEGGKKEGIHSAFLFFFGVSNLLPIELRLPKLFTPPGPPSKQLAAGGRTQNQSISRVYFRGGGYCSEESVEEEF
jgi:hypothetical protein